jgi:hypothetical protein
MLIAFTPDKAQMDALFAAFKADGGAQEALTWISHTHVAHRGAESAKVVVLQRLFAIQGERPDADRVYRRIV